jgi:GLPGLI family protein
MLKYLPFFIFLFVGTANAQKSGQASNPSGGMVVYTSRIVLNYTNLYTDTMKFNRQKSIFKWCQTNSAEAYEQAMKKVKRKHPGAALDKSKSINMSPRDTIGRINLYDALKDSLYSRRDIANRIFLLKAKKPEIHWNIADSTKKIGNYTCSKATAHFRGRDYTAWFTPQIPVPYGPWKLVGLPGLILQAYDSTGNIRFKVQKVTFGNAGTIGSMPLSGKEKAVNLAEYKHVLANEKKMIMHEAYKAVRKMMHKRNTKINGPPKMKIKFADGSDKIKHIEIFDDSSGR